MTQWRSKTQSRSKTYKPATSKPDQNSNTAAGERFVIYAHKERRFTGTVSPREFFAPPTPKERLEEGETDHRKKTQEGNQKPGPQVAEGEQRSTPHNGSDTQDEAFADTTQESRYQKAHTNYGQWLCSERAKRGWTQGQLANRLGKPTTAIRRWEKNQAYPDSRSRQRLARLLEREAPSLQGVEKSVTRFLKGLVKISVSGIIGTALLPFLGPAIATAAAVTTFIVTSIQDELEPLGLHLQEDTINKLIEPLHGKPFDESDLRKVIEELLSKDKQVNEDLAKAFIDLIPTIQKAAGSTNIEISGPVQGLIAGDNNTITQTFSGFLQEG
jgi:ribosome-binding protein aMBF1 (putative translation factor)